jgi:hypothetical protein
MTITSARRTPGKLIDTRQNLQSIQPTFLETGILFYSTGALSGMIFNFLILNCDIYFSLLIFKVTIFLNIAV